MHRRFVIIIFYFTEKPAFAGGVALWQGLFFSPAISNLLFLPNSCDDPSLSSKFVLSLLLDFRRPLSSPEYS